MNDVLLRGLSLALVVLLVISITIFEKKTLKRCKR